MLGLFGGLVKATVGVAVAPIAVVSDVIRVVDQSDKKPEATGEAVKLVTGGVKDVLTPSKW